MNTSTADAILRLDFNQNHGCFTAAMETGFRVYNTDPLVEKLRHKHEAVGSIGHVAMLHRTNIFAIVSGGSRPKYAENSVLIMDDAKTEDKIIAELTFDQPVMSVKMRFDKLVVVLRNRIHVFAFPTSVQKDWHHGIKKLLTLNTKDNPMGLCCLSSVRDNQLLVFPFHKLGSIQFLDLATAEQGKSYSPATLKAHQNELACIALNQQSTLVATASVKGTLIRVHDVVTKRLVIELRRGADTAKVYCINFSHDDEFLVTSSDKGTVHIFAIKNTQHNRRSSFRDTGLCSYVKAQWGLTNFTVKAECACICAFARPELPENADTALDRNQHSVVAICVDGTFYKYKFTTSSDTKEGGGKAIRELYNIFLDMGDDMDF